MQVQNSKYGWKQPTKNFQIFKPIKTTVNNNKFKVYHDNKELFLQLPKSTITSIIQPYENMFRITLKFNINDKLHKECIDKIKSASETENTFAYSWNIGNNLSELGKGFVFQNVIDERATKDDEFILGKKYEFFKPSISLWNKSSINLINNIFYNFNKFSHW